MIRTPIISFSVFREKILDGTKTQTVREPRVRPIREGQVLSLWWKSRTKEREFLGYSSCIRVRRMRFRDFWLDDEFARKDGFKDSAELRDFFFLGRPGRMGGHEEEDLNTPFDVIEWRYPLSPPPPGDWRRKFYRLQSQGEAEK